MGVTFESLVFVDEVLLGERPRVYEILVED